MESLTLQTILEGFDAPLNEEQAWAICFQCATHLANEWEDASRFFVPFSGINSVILAKDGNVSSSDLDSNAVKKRPSQHELVQALGVVIFQALDFGLSASEEQELSAPLSELLDRMTCGDMDEGEEGEDEGIEHDACEDDTKMDLLQVIQCCKQHLQPPLEATTHYKAVCRALVAEAVELSTFLEKISTDKDKLVKRELEHETEDDLRLQELERADWARLWMQVMRELRRGAKLKKVHLSSADSVEFELTPYEVLMEDIRSRRYTLNKVAVEGGVPPRTKKDAHAIILEFIRSRPPLHPASQRRLKEVPAPKRDPREELMDAIKQEQRLRPTPGRILERSSPAIDETDGGPGASRKVIKPDMTLFNSSFDEEEFEDSDDEDDVFDDKNKVTPSPIGPFTPLSPQSPPRALDAARSSSVAEDASEQETRLGARRHSITLCQSPSSDHPAPSDLSGAAVRPGFFPGILATDFSYEPDSIESSLECLSLTIEEVMHIRSVLTKAEQECLLVDPELYNLVAKGKVCFTCKKTRFSIFGQWSTKCKFCQRSVCTDCVSKMRIPTEHFEHIPVYTLSPSPMSPKGTTLFSKTGSVPSSPNTKKSFSPAKTPPPTSSLGIRRPSPQTLSPLPMATESPRRGLLMRAQTVVKPPSALVRSGSVERPLMSICRDCKAMVTNIIRASRLSLANAPDKVKTHEDCPSRRATRNFHLDLKPVYKRN